MTDDIAKALDIEIMADDDIHLPAEQPKKSTAIIDNIDDSKKQIAQKIDDDYDFARKMLRDLIVKSQETLDAATDTAIQAQSDKHYTSVAEIIKGVVEANKQLLQLAKTRKDAQDVGVEEKNTTINNNNLYLTTKELSELLSKNKS